LRFGFGALQIQRFFAGSTDLIELTPDQLETVRVELPHGIDAQKAASAEWRNIEQRYRGAAATPNKNLRTVVSNF
jgi:type I restriction enzyme M protein